MTQFVVVRVVAIIKQCKWHAPTYITATNLAHAISK